MNNHFETVKEWFVKIQSIANRSDALENSFSKYSGKKYLNLRIESIKEIHPVQGGYNELYLAYSENNDTVGITYNEIIYDRYHDNNEYIINEDDRLCIMNNNNLISYNEFVNRIKDYCKEIVKRYGKRR
jgi:hypothetical protein